MLDSELGLILINDGVGARDERRREDNFPCKEPAILRMGLFLDGLSLDMMMIIVKEGGKSRRRTPLKRDRYYSRLTKEAVD
jgi:hypothetical protein